MKRYPLYKNSGNEWIGEIPEHWEMKNLKFLLRDGQAGIKIGPFGSSLKLDIMKPTGYKVYGQENIIKDDFSVGNRYIDESKFDELKVYEIQEGDIVVTMMGTTGQAKVIPQGIKKGIMDSHLIRMRFKSNTNPTLIALLINGSHYIYSQLKENSKGSIMEGLNSSIIKSLLIAYPPFPEQQTIANFLYNKTHQIDSLIEKKHKQIDLLKEQRTAIINQAVTKGLDPNVKMKDSGVEWIGEIPIGWITKKVKYLGTIKSGDGVVNTKLDNDKEYPVYGGNGIMGYYDHFNREETILVIGRVGEKCGNVHLVKEKCWVTDNSLILDLWNKDICDWVYYSLDTRELNTLRNQNTQPLITSTLLKNEFIPFPPSNEQLTIIEYIDEQTQKIDSTIRKQIQRIDLLKEYHQSLISEVVTGKIDVRDEVIS